MQRHMGTKPEFSAPHSLQIVPIPTTSSLPAPACAHRLTATGLKPVEAESTWPGKRREGPTPGREVGPGESALEHAAPWEERGWRGTGIPSNLVL